MSEAEKLKRAQYKRRRRLWIIALSTVLAVFFIVALISTAVYYRMNKTFYIDYTEQGTVDYKVNLKDNGFFDEDFIAGNQGYIASLIENFEADFVYKLLMQVNNVNYEYSYKVDAQVVITDLDYNVPLYQPVFELIPEAKYTANGGSNLSVSEKVVIDYNQYNSLANSFLDTYDISNTSSMLIVRLHVNVISVCEEFDGDNNNEYVTALEIPLATKTLNAAVTTSAPMGETKILACTKGTMKNVAQGISVSFTVATVLLGIGVIVFSYVTRNKDINYTIKVKKLVNAYRSYIQQLTNGFDEDGYQVLMISSFNEMLDLRDTLQLPILMNENEDKTCTRFVIPTDSKLLYTFEIKVEDYDEIYGIGKVEDEDLDLYEAEEEALAVEEEEAPAEAEEAPVEEAEEEALAVEEAPEEEEKEPAEEEAPAEAEEAPEEEAEEEAEESAEDSEDEAEEFAADDVDEIAFIEEVAEEIGVSAVEAKKRIRFNYSFLAKLTLAKHEQKEYYKQLLEFLSGYSVKYARSWKKERVYKGRQVFAVLIFRGNTLGVALALDPKDYEGSKYRFKDISAVKRYEKTPMLMKLTSDRKLKHTKELLRAMFAKAGIATVDNSNYKPEKIVTRTRKQLLKQGLIKTNVPIDEIKD
ncbi:MAG: hypothetical protein IJF71_00330 [Clostridia bacterium]|nr:hypothetical protein [Clostridia bacterium]